MTEFRKESERELVCLILNRIRLEDRVEESKQTEEELEMRACIQVNDFAGAADTAKRILGL